jgi:hypothetical protein
VDLRDAICVHEQRVDNVRCRITVDFRAISDAASRLTGRAKLGMHLDSYNSRHYSEAIGFAEHIIAVTGREREAKQLAAV